MQDTGRRGTLAGSRHNRLDNVVRVGPLIEVPTALRELGAEAEAIIESAGFRPAQFTDPDTEISYIAGSRLLAHCVDATGCPHFGLLVGVRAAPSSLGIAGFMLGSAPDVGTALRNLVQHLDLHDRGGVPTLLIQGGSTLLGYAIHTAGAQAVDQIYDLSIAVACNIMRGLCGADWNPAEVLLSRRPPADLRPHRQFFRAPLRFNAERNAVVFPSRWLDHRIPGADALLYRHLERTANELHTRRKTHIVSEVRGLLRKSLADRKSTIGDVARQLGMHERTLHRRLREEGTSFQRQLDDVRHEMARQLLAGSAMPIARVATTLNYADTSAFSRAFKRWTGVTPARWREHKKAAS